MSRPAPRHATRAGAVKAGPPGPPDPRHAHEAIAACILSGNRVDLPPKVLDALIEAPPIAGEIFDDTQHARRQNVCARSQDDRQLGAQEAQALAHRDALFQHEGTDLINDAGALRDEPLAHPMKSLKVELIGRLGSDELHRRSLHRLRNRLRIVKSFFCPLA
jgi:hypothetical protein